MDVSKKMLEVAREDSAKFYLGFGTAGSIVYTPQSIFIVFIFEFSSCSHKFAYEYGF